MTSPALWPCAVLLQTISWYQIKTDPLTSLPHHDKPPDIESSISGVLVNSTAPATTIAPASVMAPASQSINVASIRTHIPVSLDLQASNYTKWRTFFLAMVGKFGLLSTR